MANKTWLATAQTSPFHIDLTMAEIMPDLEPGWQRTSTWYADADAASAPPTSAAVA